MAGEDQTQAPPASGEPQTAPAEAQTQGQAPAPVPYERFKEVNERAKALEDRLSKFEKAQKEAEEARAKEQGEYKSLYEKLQAELAAERTNNLKMKLASSKGLPVELVNRIQGDTEEAIGSDIDSLLAFMKEKPKGSVPPPPQGGSNTAFDFATATPEQVREHLAKSRKSQ